MIITPAVSQVQPIGPYNPAVAWLDRVSELAGEARRAAFAACLENEGPLPCPPEFAGTTWERSAWASGVEMAGAEINDRWDAQCEEEAREDAEWAAFAKAHAVAWDAMV